MEQREPVFSLVVLSTDIVWLFSAKHRRRIRDLRNGRSQGCRRLLRHRRQRSLLLLLNVVEGMLVGLRLESTPDSSCGLGHLLRRLTLRRRVRRGLRLRPMFSQQRQSLLRRRLGAHCQCRHLLDPNSQLLLWVPRVPPLINLGVGRLPLYPLIMEDLTSKSRHPPQRRRKSSRRRS